MNNYNDHFKKMKSNSFPVRVKDSKKRKRVQKQQGLAVSIKWGGLCVLSFLLAIYGFLYPEVALSLYDRISVFSISQAKDTVNPAETKEPQKEDVAASTKSKKSPVDSKNLTEVSDNANYIEYLEQRKQGLDQKEKELKELEEKLQIEKIALEKKVEELELARRDIASKLESRVQEDEERVKKLVDMYTNMKPQSAAQVIATLDEELAIHVLKRMKKQDSGNILNFMNPEKAKKLSEKYTGY